MSSHRSRRAASRAERASSRRSPSPPKKSPAPEILFNLGRVVLPFVVKKLNEKNGGGGSGSGSSRRRETSGPRERERTRSKSRSRSRATARDRDSDRDTDRDIHSLVSQVAVGLLAVGVRQVIKKRKEAKRAAASAALSTTKDDQYKQRLDPELSRALEATARELQGASESIRRLSRTPGHKGRCEVQDELVKDAERLENTLGGIQAGIHNMRNLHPGLNAGEQKPAERGDPWERPRKRSRWYIER
ncbi:hypothetical protein QBC38DRAFT_36311 [Podospora fimiseda]|uniref:Uncharacterized protein n=1 Tax=Podospora fimiseda TaxID=252190 RepID=A0AAN7BIH9_9PEZI|nr:hypothetical protein QBC38DRAFT_36311 [Podospora fimiseda]